MYSEYLENTSGYSFCLHSIVSVCHPPLASSPRATANSFSSNRISVVNHHGLPGVLGVPRSFEYSPWFCFIVIAVRQNKRCAVGIATAQASLARIFLFLSPPSPWS
jgi:hypothetical protein